MTWLTNSKASGFIVYGYAFGSFEIQGKDLPQYSLDWPRQYKFQGDVFRDNWAVATFGFVFVKSIPVFNGNVRAIWMQWELLWFFFWFQRRVFLPIDCQFLTKISNSLSLRAWCMFKQLFQKGIVTWERWFRSSLAFRIWILKGYFCFERSHFHQLNVIVWWNSLFA